MSGISPIPSNPFHIARAYGVQPPAAPRAAAPVFAPSGAGVAGSIKPPTAKSPLAAAIVPGKVQFNGAAPTDNTAAIPFYRHPADKNAAATLLSAGRELDITG
jgi:hypothetical protein